MKKMILIASILMASSHSFADSSPQNHEALFAKITASPAYKKYVQNVRGDFWCNFVTEVKTSKEYGTNMGDRPGYRVQLAMLDCAFNPHDGGDAIGYVGIAVMNPGEILSFTAEAYPQPD